MRAASDTQAIAAAVRAMEDEIPTFYVARLGENAYRCVSAGQLDDLPPGTPLVARIAGAARVERLQTTAGQRVQMLDAVIRVVLGPRPRPASQARTALPQPHTPDEAHGYAVQFGGA